MCDFDAPLDGMLLHSDMLCVLRYHPHDGAEDALDGAQEVTKKNREDEQEKDQGAAEKTGVSGLPDTGVSGLRLGHHRCQAAFATGMGSGVWPECGRKLRPIDLTGVSGLPDTGVSGLRLDHHRCPTCVRYVYGVRSMAGVWPETPPHRPDRSLRAHQTGISDLHQTGVSGLQTPESPD